MNAKPKKANTELVVALIAGAVSLIAAGLTVWNARQSNNNSLAIEELKIGQQKQEAAEKRAEQMSYYREPLARSAYELKNRLYNILNQNLIQVYLVGGDDRTKAYVRNHTTFVIAQYLCWSKIVSREIQYIDTGQIQATRDLQTVQSAISNTLSTDSIRNPALRLFSGEQEEVGEALQQPNKKDLWECMGYGTFLKTFPVGADALIDALKADIADMGGPHLGGAEERLHALYVEMTSLLNLLDPNATSFPQFRTNAEKAGLAN